MTPVVLGIDLSLTATGMSDGASTWDVRSKGSEGASLLERAERLEQLRDHITGHITGVGLVVIEGPSYGQARQGGQHDRAGLWWLVVGWTIWHGVPVVEVAPAALKKYATGSGAAKKSAVVDATARRFPAVDTGGGDDNRCDALWLAAMGIDRLGGGSVVPAAQRAVLDKVAWPEAVAA